MRAGKGSSDAYMEDWKRVRTPCEGDLQSAAETAAKAIDEQFSDEQLERLVKAKGIADNVASN